MRLKIDVNKDDISIDTDIVYFCGCKGQLVPLIRQNQYGSYPNGGYGSKPELLWKCAKCGNLLDFKK